MSKFDMDELKNYIRQQRASLLGDVKIKELLLAAGHQQEVIDEAMLKASSQDAPAYKLYSQNAIFVGAFFAGILCVTYMMYKNYLALKRDHQAKVTLWVGSISFMLTIIAILILNINENGYYISILAAMLAGILQKGEIDHHKKISGTFFSMGNIIKIMVASLAVTVVSVIVIVHILWFGAALFGSSPLEREELSTSSEIENIEKSEISHSEVGVNQIENLTSDWSRYENKQLGIAFNYPNSYGTVYTDFTLGAPAGSGFEHENCRPGNESEGSIACTGLIIGFVDEKNVRKPFLVAHGRYMDTAPQGGWWGLSQIPEGEQGLSISLGNENVWKEPNMSYYGLEMGGDFYVQYIKSEKLPDSISHIIVASPIQMVVFPSSVQVEWSEKQKIYPWPELADFPTTEAWQDAYAQYHKDTMIDVSGNDLVKEYVEMINSISWI